MTDRQANLESLLEQSACVLTGLIVAAKANPSPSVLANIRAMEKEQRKLKAELSEAEPGIVVEG